MAWLQRRLDLRPQPCGVHLITEQILAALPELAGYRHGLLHVFIQHSSASLALNENADPDVRHDLAAWLARIAPENEPYYRHTCEGPDDMPAHLKSVLTGPSLSLPVSAGRLAIGTWQGIYLCEHRRHAGARRLLLTLQGETTAA